MNLLKQINDPADMRRLPQSKLQPLADEIREYMIETLSKIGGHTGASLGPVELITALHYSLDTPRDRLVFDIGHQAYAHKILTGRRDQFPTIRQYNGLSGFLRREESEYDVFNAAHAGTSISSALGIAAARDLKGEDFNVIAFIGDAGLTAGMALEGINQVGHLKSKMIILLNDNEMSISPNVGALAGYLNRIRTARPYNEFKHEVEEWLKAIPAVGEMMLSGARALKDTLAAAFIPGALWEELGLKYMGPINGHDINSILTTLEAAKQIEGPVLIHALTVKGKGYEPAERDKAAWHGTSAFEIASGKFIKEPATAPTYTATFADAAIAVMNEDPRVVAITAAMPDGTGLSKVMKAFPERTYDVAIAEQHAVTFAAGMATEGLKPAVLHNGPASVRYPRGNGFGVVMDEEIKQLEIGKAEIVRQGTDVAIIGIGTQVHYCEKAAERLAAEGLNPTVVNARYVKPLDAELILALARSHGSIVTVEDHYVQAGFGSAVMELLEENGVHDVRVMCLGFPDKLIEHASQSTLLAKYGLDADSIYNRVREFVAAKYSFEATYHD